MTRGAVLPGGASSAIAAGLTVAIVVAWGLFAWLALDMDGGLARLMMPASAAWTPANGLAVLVMWAIMMAAMMLPGAVPMVLMYGRLAGRGEPCAAGRRTGFFTIAYLVTWAAFSLGATGLQWGLQVMLVLSPMGFVTHSWVMAALLVGAGVYQFTPLKDVCLTGCRTPFGFLMTQWRDGDLGAFAMGLRHGAYCVGCCWALMILAFVGGTMNLVWMAILTVVVTAEKVVPRGNIIARGIGGLLIAGGVFHAAASL